MKIVIVGAGEVGYHIASRLSMENKDVIVIEKDANALRRVFENLDVQTVKGCGSSPAILEQAGIKEADILLAVTDSDETNLVASLFANILSPTTIKLARIRSEDYLLYQDALSQDPYSIDVVINPEAEAVKTVERLLQVPGAVDVGEFADGRIKLIGVRLDRDCPVAGIKLVDLKAKTGHEKILVAAIIRKEALIIPSGDDKILEGDLIYFVSEEKGLKAALKIFGKRAEPFNRILIIGGGNLGLKLAKALERLSIHTKLIEKDPDRCRELAEHLDKVIVLQGNGTDQRLLQEENIQDMDVVATMTGDEETNILTSLLAKRMGAHKTVTRISKFIYFPLVSAIGLEHIVSSRLAAINTILQYVRRGKVLSVMALKGEEAEVLEAVALETSDIVGKPLRQIPFPKSALVVAIIRGDEVIIPTGDSVILPEDRIIIFSTRQSIPRVEKALTVKLEYF
ncbi:MAG: Trk system potassium transporter TrkA [Deltaproteobacteria bacterium]|nr:Trk system potassium transporter TrkA [Deltaproteobacteria bacterium]MBW2019226.1 Trk system potassium transporter TrkA [Deltaproteobacteria bacterium]MBW2074032.1 Trk system potassium transporter TrkA [Deltaproteobacteria bacterium]RLB80390.1 MAG: Trk system potassium transporter TrkA [Deltaproteobacteria bacterium]